MEPRFYLRILSIIVIISSIFYLNDARSFPEQTLNKPKVLESLQELESINGEPYGLPSPWSLPPLESLSPPPQPIESPLSSVGSPLVPSIFPTLPPSTTIPNISPQKSPPKNSPLPPMQAPLPTPPPPQHTLSPPKLLPSPLAAQPPPPHKKPQFAVWCVAKPTVPDLEIQEALDYACGSGADCKPIRPNGPCFQPDTLVSHASYAFNSYWQKTKAAGGTCDFGGTAMLVSIDPSFDDCNYTVN